MILGSGRKCEKHFSQIKQMCMFRGERHVWLLILEKRIFFFFWKKHIISLFQIKITLITTYYLTVRDRPFLKTAATS